jgi:hypothetical protein
MASAYLATCPNHYLNITTDTNDVVLGETTKFSLKNTTKGKTVKERSNPILSLQWLPEWSESKWKYVFEFPSPDSIFGLGAEYISIQDGPKPWDGKYARALRFRYRDSENPYFDGLEEQPEEFDATHYDGAGSFYAIDIRYHDMEVSEQPEDYDDAEECFENMRSLLPPCDQWTVRFNRESEIWVESPSLPHPRDCSAPVLVLTDGIEIGV